MRRLLVAFLLLFSFALPCFAAGINEDERAALAVRIESFGEAMRDSDMDAVLGVVPPQMLEAVAAQFGVTVEALIEATQTEIDRAMAQVELVSYGMSLDQAEFATLPDGMTYALIPTETVMDLAEEGGWVRSQTTTVALLEEGTWYLVRIDDEQQVAILRQVYPGFVEVTFPQGQMELVEE